ncbi:HAD family hydrolase [Synoicihabitans lomoniglobus]|uniref:phosphoglycolate phosphatase n=1 Tax=Synoicihabitans lomoniglobus TaxID=2909285 RepID=A0AAF0I3G3_9BACT|nr:haloacid dehalogenase-like hydrolase [Opitutaceae bacterium LMO-M01]WED65895.1 HAD family hydrolase [Opitutaceae bacterium LMO-M01]
MKLLLWDIDGTLLASGGAGLRALEQATESVFNLPVPADLSTIDWAGRTDRWIAAKIFEKYDIEHTPDNVTRLLETYIGNLPAELSRTTAVLPGILALLTEVQQRNDIAQGLLTGNLERGAKTKLGHFDLWNYFPFGAFADDSAIRNELGPHALRRAAAHHDRTFAPTDVWIIGDTPHDIACGQIIGARTLAVATGHHTRDQLAAHAPDAGLDDLSNSAEFWAVIDGD